MPETIEYPAPEREEIVIRAHDPGHREAEGKAPGLPAVDAEEEDQYEGQPERGHGVEQERRAAQKLVQEGMLSDGLHHAQENAQGERKDQSRPGEEQGVGKGRGDQVPDGKGGGQGILEVASYEGPEPPPVLDPQGGIQAKVPANLFDGLRREIGIQVEGSRITRRQTHRHEDQGEDPQEEGNGRQSPAQGIGNQGSLPPQCAPRSSGGIHHCRMLAHSPRASMTTSLSLSFTPSSRKAEKR